MSESTLTLAYSDLRAEIGSFLGYGRAPANWDTEKIATVESVLQRGLRQFYLPPFLPGQDRSHPWSFLHPVTTLATVASYSTGTVSSSGTTVTLTAGTWPAWAATNGTLTVDSTDYEIATRISDSQLTLVAAPTAAFASDTYSMDHDGNYDLPDDFGAIESNFTFETDAAGWAPRNGIAITGEGTLRNKRQFSVANSCPSLAALRCKAATGTTGQRFAVMFWPIPDAAYTLSYRYTAIPGKLTATLPYPLGGALHSETILASCMAAAELKVLGEKGMLWATFIERLAASTSLDNRATAPTHFGYNGDGSDGFGVGRDRTNYVTVGGVRPS